MKSLENMVFNTILESFMETMKHSGKPVVTNDLDEVVELTCRKCIFEGVSKEEIDSHMKDCHGVFAKLPCNLCEFHS